MAIRAADLWAISRAPHLMRLFQEIKHRRLDWETGFRFLSLPSWGPRPPGFGPELLSWDSRCLRFSAPVVMLYDSGGLRLDLMWSAEKSVAKVLTRPSSWGSESTTAS